MKRVITVCGLVSVCGSAWGQMAFVDAPVAGLVGDMLAPGMTSGIAAADFDNDGDIDLLYPTADGIPTRLFRNNADGTFTDVAQQLGLVTTLNDRVGLFFDYDADGRLDVVIANDRFGFPDAGTFEPTVRLFRQMEDGTFQERTQAAGLGGFLLDDGAQVMPTSMHVGSMAVDDLDVDGDLDLVVALWSDLRFVYRNNGDGTFTDVTASSGVGPTFDASWQMLIHDFTRDGIPDLVCNVDFSPNRMFVGSPGLAYTDIAPALSIDTAWNEMGAAMSDFDNDGDIDLYHTNIHNADGDRGDPYVDTHSVFFRNDSSESGVAFAEVSQSIGVAEGDWGWGCTFADYDHDGWVDLAATNGFFQFNLPYFYTDRSKLFRNTGAQGGPVAFEEVGLDVGITDTDGGGAFISVDIDRDGDLDIVQNFRPVGGIRVYTNQTVHAQGEGGWIVVQPRRQRASGAPLSEPALVRLFMGDDQMTRVVTVGTSMGSQEPYEAHFGVGARTTIDAVVVEWPGGVRASASNLPAGEIATLFPCSDCALADTDDDGVANWGVFDANHDQSVDIEDLYAQSAQPADVNQDGDTSAFDTRCLEAFLRRSESASAIAAR